MASWDPRVLKFFQKHFPAVTFLQSVGDIRLLPAAYIVSYGLNELAEYYGHSVEVDFAHDDPGLFLPRVRASSMTGSRISVGLIEDFIHDVNGIGEEIMSGVYFTGMNVQPRDHSAAMQELIEIQKGILEDEIQMHQDVMMPVNPNTRKVDVEGWLRQWQPEGFDLTKLIEDD